MNKTKVENYLKKLANVNYVELIYMILCAYYIMIFWLQTTMLECVSLYSIANWMKYILEIFTVARLAIDIYKLVINKTYIELAEIFFRIFIIIIGYLVWQNSYDYNAFILGMLIANAVGVKWKKIGYVYVCISIISLAIAFYCSTHGIIPDISYASGDRGVRHSYGIIYPTDMAAHYLFLFMVYAAIREDKLTLTEITIMLVMGFIINDQTDARNDFYCIVALCVVLYIVTVLLKFKIRLSKFKILRIVSFTALLLAVVCIILTSYYDPSSDFFIKLDKILSSRVSLSYRGLEQYGIKPFGQFVQEDKNILGYYFFLDSSYIRFAVKYGWVFLSVICYMFYRIVNRLFDAKKDVMIVILLAMAVTGIVEHHIVELAYGGVIWIMLYADVTHFWNGGHDNEQKNA